MNVNKKWYGVFPIFLLLSMLFLVTSCSKAVNAKGGDTVKVGYTLTLSDGTVYDTTEGGEPIEFTIGNDEVIEGFEEAVIGMKVGETKTVTIPPNKAYGEYDESLVFVVDRADLPSDTEPTVGLQLQTTNSDGTVFIYTILEVNEDTVTIDGNSELVGQDLTFKIKLLEITFESE
jgi:peptidylprolyl isomerase